MMKWRVFSIKDCHVEPRWWADWDILNIIEAWGEVEWRRAWLEGVMGSKSTKGGWKGITPPLHRGSQKEKKPLGFRGERKEAKDVGL
ncbi:hypothetical protein MA16_Dca027689 [Dendrobium catenatum]|uniref:Uncharacterized protein n=1 Tax=Dendrobium catenatum TaxID=906689 RepID=A0A2I0V976_9ASPA|nr:hypothetical protein MA16_Dca027689 [Dendrobium catenatum]